MSSILDQIHAQALEVSGRYRRAEVELVGVLQEVERRRVFLKRGHSSLFSYVTLELGLSEHTAYDLITVARKAREVPALQAKLREGSLTLSKARRVASVLTLANQDEWIGKACALSSRQLEKEIARVRPEAATPERATYVGGDRVRLELGLSECEMLRLRRAQDLLCQSRRRGVSLEETIGVMTGEFLKKNDPVEKAKRHQVKKGPAEVSSASAKPSAPVRPSEPAKPSEPVKTLGTVPRREPIPAATLHAVNLRDGRRCAHVDAQGSRCNQSRWVEIHHKVPLAQGGAHAIDNLITLCSSHHKLRHLAD